MSEWDTTDPIEAIAVIGLAGQFPGAQNVEQFWHNLCQGVESIDFFDEHELDASAIDPAIRNHPQYMGARGKLGDIALFAANFFGYSPREAEQMDPQHRLFLECAWQALEDAGYDVGQYDGSIGIYAGVGINTYLLNYLHQGPLEAGDNFGIFIANDKDFLTTRVSYKLNLTGPSVTVQTACSTSLVAICHACQSLQNYLCDMVLAGGVTIVVPQETGYIYQEGGVMSADGHCRAFAAEATGFVGGNGLGLVLLKRLSDALADGDTIHAVIKGWAMNNDGAMKVSYTAPSVGAQAEVIAMAQAMAGIDAGTIGYVETHGAGTPLGDPIEIAALTQVFRNSTQANSFCALGSVKTNVGHLDTAAGIAGFIKTVLALKHGQIPPSLHFERPNPHIQFDDTPFYVNTQLSAWETEGNLPRRAGISSLGIGGTNAHLILEEAPPQKPSGPSRPYQLLLLSAKTETALAKASDNLLAYWQAHPDQNVADMAYTYQLGRKPFNYRQMLLCSGYDDGAAALETADPKRILTNHCEPGAYSVVFMFPGGGSQHVHMAQDLYRSEPVFRDTLDQCAHLLRQQHGLDILKHLYPAGEPSAADTAHMAKTSVALPALFAVEYALAQLWLSWGIQPRALIGHSLGEYVAACLAGVIALPDALSLVAYRGQLFEQLPAGAMLAVSLPETAVRPYLDETLAVAAVNSPSFCVISGSSEAIVALQTTLEQEQVHCRRLHIEVAAHSQMVEPILEPFRRWLNQLKLQPPQIPYLSNVTGTWITPAEATDPAYWVNHLRQTVRFADGIQTVLAEARTILLEVGPGHSLSTLARQHPDFGQENLALTSLGHPQDKSPDLARVLNTLGQLWLMGVAVNWANFYQYEQRQRIQLPTYPFERQRYWAEKRPRFAQGRTTLPGRQNNIDEWFYMPVWKRSLPPVPLKPGTLARQKCTWLLFANQSSLSKQLHQRLLDEGQLIITVLPGSAFAQVDETTYVINPEAAQDYEKLVSALQNQSQIADTILHLWTLDIADEAGQALFQSCQTLGYGSLIYLAQALASLSDETKLLVLTDRLSHPGQSGELTPEKALLLGPCRVIPQEIPHINCRSIDLTLPAAGSTAESALVDHILAECLSSQGEPAIAYDGRFRYTYHLEPISLAHTETPVRPLRTNGVYLILGGFGRIGSLIADYLARTVQARLVLVGRTPLPPREAWSQATDDNVRQRIAQIKQLEAAGAKVLPLTADIANDAQMQAVIANTLNHYGELHAVFHAAGVLAGDSFYSPISAVTLKQSAEQFRAKGYGLYALDNALQNQAIDFCLLISSNAAILGGLGLAAYAAANSFVDAFANSRNHQAGEIRWISTNWDGWRTEEALASGTLQASIDQYALVPTESLAALHRILSIATVDQVIVSAGNLPDRYRLWVEAPRTQAKTTDGESYARPQLRNRFVPPRNQTEQKMAELWQALLGIEQIGIHDNFFELGGHSLLATQVMAQVRAEFKLELPLVTLFENPTVAELTLAILQKQTEQLDSETLAQLQEELQNLSEAELAALLAEEQIDE